MIENKRFTFIHFDWLQWHIYDNESLLCEVTDDEDAENLCKLLNELNDENIRLKNKLKFLNELNKPYGVIIEENMRLKAFIKRLANDCGEIILMNGIGYKADKILGDFE